MQLLDYTNQTVSSQRLTGYQDWKNQTPENLKRTFDDPDRQDDFLDRNVETADEGEK